MQPKAFEILKQNWKDTEEFNIRKPKADRVSTVNRITIQTAIIEYDTITYNLLQCNLFNFRAFQDFS